MELLIKNAKILTMDNALRIIENGYISIKESLVENVGSMDEMPENLQAKSTIDAKGRLVMPGLINTHTHISMTLLRNLANDLPLQQWLFNNILPAEDKFSEEDVYWGALLGIAEMIKTGTTCFADMYFFQEMIARAVDESGMRANLASGKVIISDSYDFETDLRIKGVKQLFNNWNNKAEGRIKVYIGAHSVYTCELPYLKDVVMLAKEWETGIHIHLSETKTEVDNSIKNYGCTPIEYCNNMGMFEVPIIAAHCVHLTDRDIDILKQTGVNVSHNPGSNLKLGSGIARLPEMLQKGVNVALGTDGPASNNNLDMFEEVRLAALISKGFYMNAELISAAEALRMAINNGAKALGFGSEIGEIKKGMKADLIMIDTDKINYIPEYDYISALAYSSNSQDVDTVIVNGKILMEGRELKTIDEEKVKFSVREKSKALISRV